MRLPVWLLTVGVVVGLLIIYLQRSATREHFAAAEQDEETDEKKDDSDTSKPSHNESKFQDDEFYQYDPESDDPTGMDLCLDKCDGSCVWYGYTRSAWCYPYYDGQLEDVQKERQRKQKRMDTSVSLCHDK